MIWYSEGNFAFNQVDGENTFSGIFNSIKYISLGSTLIAAFSLANFTFMGKNITQKRKIFKLIQGPLVAVVVGIIYVLFSSSNEVLGFPQSTCKCPDSR